jgi:hypothetical protein
VGDDLLRDRQLRRALGGKDVTDGQA